MVIFYPSRTLNKTLRELKYYHENINFVEKWQMDEKREEMRKKGKLLAAKR